MVFFSRMPFLSFSSCLQEKRPCCNKPCNISDSIDRSCSSRRIPTAASQAAKEQTNLQNRVQAKKSLNFVSDTVPLYKCTQMWNLSIVSVDTLFGRTHLNRFFKIFFFKTNSNAHTRNKSWEIITIYHTNLDMICQIHIHLLHKHRNDVHLKNTAAITVFLPETNAISP